MHQVIFYLSLKKQSYYFRKVKQDDKGRNWLTLSYSVRERPSSLKYLRRYFFLTPSDRISHCTHIVRTFAVIFLPDLGLKFVYPTINLTFLVIIARVKRNFACTVLNNSVFNLVTQNIFPLLSKAIVIEK